MARSGLYTHRSSAKWLYTMRGALYASALYPLTFAALLLAANFYVERKSWQPPEVKRHTHRRYNRDYYRTPF